MQTIGLYCYPSSSLRAATILFSPPAAPPSDELASARKRRVANPPQVANLPYIAPDSSSIWLNADRLPLTADSLRLCRIAWQATVPAGGLPGRRPTDHSRSSHLLLRLRVFAGIPAGKPEKFVAYWKRRPERPPAGRIACRTNGQSPEARSSPLEFVRFGPKWHQGANGQCRRRVTSLGNLTSSACRGKRNSQMPGCRPATS